MAPHITRAHVHTHTNMPLFGTEKRGAQRERERAEIVREKTKGDMCKSTNGQGTQRGRMD